MLFKVLFQNLEALQEKFHKLNGKCEKYGNDKLSFVTVGDILKENSREYINIEVSGMTPLVGNHKLISVISKLDDDTNMVNTIPGEELPKSFRTADFKQCDHCGINRYRKELVVVRDETGKYIQLGKTCLKDYLGINLEELVNKFSWLNDLIIQANDEEYFGGQGFAKVVNPESYLACVSVCCRKMGYVKSNDDYDREPTKYTAFSLYYPTPSFYDIIKQNELYVEDIDLKLAKDALEYCKDIDGESDYCYNLRSIAKQEYCGSKQLGYLASMIPVYKRHLGTLEASKNKKVSEWVGELKDRLTFKAKVVFSKELNSNFGLKTMLKFVDESGANLTWFASGLKDLEVGKEYSITGTVKKHDTFRDEKQTILTRVKVLENV